MSHYDLKDRVNKLFPVYVTTNDKEKCIDELFILIYYHPKNFAITMKDETLNDFLSTLYPKLIKNIFSKYNKEKSSFFTFTCLCLKNHIKGFLRKLYLKNAIDETILMEMTNNENSKTLDANNSASQDDILESNIDELFNPTMKYEENNMKKMLLEWLSQTKSLQHKKNYKRAIFVLSCKTAYVFNEKLIKKIAEYIEIPENLLRYYISKLNLEYADSSNAKKLLEVKNQRNKYFLRKTTAEVLLGNENLSKSGKNILECSREYSIEKYVKACKRLEIEKQSISNRTISRITGISRSMIDRILIDISEILKYKPSIKDK